MMNEYDMTTRIETRKTFSLDRHVSLTSRISDGFKTRTLTPQSKSYFEEELKSKLWLLQKNRIDEQTSVAKPEPTSISKNEDEKITPPNESNQKKSSPSKRRIFKTKKNSINRKNSINSNSKVVTLSSGTVAELTMKFNEMVSKNSIEETQLKKLLKHVNSFNVDPEAKPKPILPKPRDVAKPKVNRKPSVKTKPDRNLVIVKRKIPANKPSVMTTTGDKKLSSAKIENVPKLNLAKPSTLHLNLKPSSPSVKATIEIFEKRSAESPTTPVAFCKDSVPKSVPKLVLIETEKDTTTTFDQEKPKVQCEVVEKDAKSDQCEKTEFDIELLPIVNIPLTAPPKRCDSMLETLHRRKIVQYEPLKKPPEVTGNNESISIQPNTSFLWSRSQSLVTSQLSSTKIEESIEIIEDTYDIIDALPSKPLTPTPPRMECPEVPPRPKSLKPIIKQTTKKYEDTTDDGYEYCSTSINYEKISNKTEDDYEICEDVTTENIYEILPPKKHHQEPLPLPPTPSESSSTNQVEEVASNCYESIYNSETNTNKGDNESNYESIYSRSSGNGSGSSNRDSIVSSVQMTNSIYGKCPWDEENIYNGKASSDLSSGDRSDEWVDIASDNDERGNSSSGIFIVREKLRPKKSSQWSQQCRQQWSKSSKLSTSKNQNHDSDSDHYYESLSAHQQNLEEDDDTFESDLESENSFTNVSSHNNSDEVLNNQLPAPPNSYDVLNRLAATAGKHMRNFKKNLSMTKSDITKSLSRMTKRRSRNDISNLDEKKENRKLSLPIEIVHPRLSIYENEETNVYQNCQVESNDHYDDQHEKTKSLTRGRGLLDKFRRSMSMSAEAASELTSNLNGKPKSTFYLTETIDVDANGKEEDKGADSGVSLSPVQRTSRFSPVRPQSPPPPAPTQNGKKAKDKSSTSWYAEVGLFKNEENAKQSKRSSTCWYAEVGLYQNSNSPPSSSSTENSGTNSNIIIQCEDKDSEMNYANSSLSSFSSAELKPDGANLNLLKNLTEELDIQLRLQYEPLYQFYDAAVLESVCKDGISDFDSDNYEDLINRRNLNASPCRPSAMELISPKRNSLAFTRTLWCEIPEVLQSSVLSTLSSHQRKLQEAKFEMVTSEASYLNSLNVLSSHFLKNLVNSEILTEEEHNMMFVRIMAVKEVSNKLLMDLEKCWQDNIFLHGVCEIIQKHAEENFSVYIPYCENQIVLDTTLKRLKERSNFCDILKRLESSPICQSLSLYSFLMLPMQRITRWPLLVDAVLKRLSPQDPEYVSCQYVLATLNKIVNQCNEAARIKERELEMINVERQLEFPKGMLPIPITIPNRWLVRSGTVTHIQPRSDELKLTFGKKLGKIPLQLFLFNDLLVIAKAKTESLYTVMHYCLRGLVEISTSDVLTGVPTKDVTSKNLILLTILENQDGKMVEFMISCNSETDKERWIDSLSPRKSEDPEETLYECWDCPQVTAVHNYIASQPDELALSRGDVINVLRKMADGWYHGERIRDQQTGWFPANYTVEVANPHVRARNLKQRYRLLAFSENYLKSK